MSMSKLVSFGRQRKERLKIDLNAKEKLFRKYVFSQIIFSEKCLRYHNGSSM